METPLHVKISGWIFIIAAAFIAILWTSVFLVLWGFGKTLHALAKTGGVLALAFGGMIWLALRGIH